MSEERGEARGLLVGLLLGAIVGAVAGLLFAPTTGEEARGKVKGFIDELPEKARSFGDKVKETLKRKDDSDA